MFKAQPPLTWVADVKTDRLWDLNLKKKEDNLEPQLK